jgi:hypothetical protein
MRRRGLFGIVLGIVLAATSAARAEMVRIPAAGEPAFAFEAPEGWTVFVKAPNALRLASAGGHAALELSIVDSAEVAAMPVSAIGADILRMAGLPPPSMIQAGAIGGFPGEGYTVRGTNEKGVALTAILTVAKLDASHVATMMRATADGISSTEAADLQRLIDRVRIVGVK